MNLLRSPLFLVLLAALMACNTTQRVVHFSPESSRVTPLSSNEISNLQAEYGNVDGVYLSYNQVLEHNVNIAFTSTIPHWKFYEIVDRTRVVFNPEASDLNTFRLEVPAHSRLEQLAINVQAPGGAGLTYSKRDLVATEDSQGSKIYTLNYPGIQPGTVVSEKYELLREDLERNPPTMHDVPLQYRIPVQDLQFQYVYPIWWQVRVKKLGVNQPLNYQRLEEADRRKIILQYDGQNIPAFEEGENTPYFKQAAAYFQLQVTNLTMGSAVKVRAPEDWTAFARDYRGLTADMNTRPSRSIQRLSDQLVGHLINDTERVETILTYVADNIFVDPTSRQRNLDTVLSRREGNPFMVAGLMQSMLAAARIPSEYLLVHPAYEGYFDPDFYADVQLQEPALGLLLGGEQRYVFPGNQRSLSEPIPPHLIGQTAMVITPEGFGGFTEVFSDQIVETPPPVIVDNGTVTPPVEDPLQQPPPDLVIEEPERTIPRDPVEPRPEPVVEDPPTVQTTPQNPPISEPANGRPANTGSASTIVGSPIGQPIDSSTQQQIPDVEETTPPPEEQAEPHTLPTWLGSIRRSFGGWTWVVASRTTMEEAEEVANEYLDLYRQGVNIDVLIGETDGVVRYRIGVGQYASRELATAERARMGSLLPSDAWLLEIQSDM